MGGAHQGNELPCVRVAVVHAVQHAVPKVMKSRGAWAR
jgi:hypothetical protein